LDSHKIHEVIVKYGLLDRFHEYCKRVLWKGLCGRCGRMGDHFSNQCHLTASSGFGARPLLRAITIRQQPVQSDLLRFLECLKLQAVAPLMSDTGISSLNSLGYADFDSINASILAKFEGKAEARIIQLRPLSPLMVEEFRTAAGAKVQEDLLDGKSQSQYLMFLSHYKVEAGTEAALIRSEIQQLIVDDPSSVGNRFDAPVFLDSDDLRNLDELRSHVQRSHNLVLLLTEGLFTRPWCLVEIVTAVREGVPFVPVVVSKPGLPPFKFPDDGFYAKLLDGKHLDEGATDLLRKCDIELEEVGKCIKQVFKIIALPYAPHESASLRRTQVEAILHNCTLKNCVSLDF